MAVPDNVLHSLHAMDGYDRMLALDKIAREHGIEVEQLSVELQEFTQRGATAAAVVSHPLSDEDDFDNPTAPKNLDDLNSPSEQSSQHIAATSPRYIDDSSTLRMRYDPSVEGGQRQSGVTQAILCPTCSAPLGIPSTRPIKITCPNCATESLFEN